MPGLSIRANGSSLPLVLIKRIAHVRGGGRVTLSVTATAVPAPPKGEPSLASPFGGRWCPVGTVQRRPSRQARVPSKGGRRGQPASVSTQPMRGAAGNLPSQSRLPPCQLPQRGSQVCAPPKACAKLSLASPFGGGAPAGGGEGEVPAAPSHGLCGNVDGLPPPLTNVAERGTIEIEKESLPVRRLAQISFYLRKSSRYLAGATTFSCF